MVLRELGEYGPVFAELIESAEPMPLGPGRPNDAAAEALAAMSVDRAFADAPVTDMQMARACLAGVWLLHNFLDRSHRISQGLDSPTGSYWHALMHRREPDYPNARYWLRRTGDHPIHPPLGEVAHELNGPMDVPKGAAFLLAPRRWDPNAFVDLVEAVERGRSDARDLCVAVQHQEWRLLFDHCYQAATNR